MPLAMAVDLNSAQQQGDFYDLFLMALCVWREARGQSMEAKRCVSWVIRNRADQPGWWGGPSIASVVLKPWQFSSFNQHDPNSSKLPLPADPSWVASLIAAQEGFTKSAKDPTLGATHYYDRSLDPDQNKPDHQPVWAVDGSYSLLADVGDFHFYKAAHSMGGHDLEGYKS